MDNKQQPEVEDIIDIIESNFKEFKGSNEAVLHAAEDIIELFKPFPTTEAPDKIPSARQFYLIKKKEHGDEVVNMSDNIDWMESFALLRDQRAVEVERKNSIESFVKKDIVIWVVPASEPKMNGKIDWGWEIEFLPYKSIGKYMLEAHNHYVQYPLHESGKYYNRWDTYEEAKQNAIEYAEKMHNEWFFRDTKKYPL